MEAEEEKEASEMVFNKTTHLVGAVSSGKSSLIQVIAYIAKKRNQHITILVGDVGRQLQLFNDLQELNVPSVPIIGKGKLNERHIQFNKRQYSSYKYDDSKKIRNMMKRSEYRYLSNVCILNGFLNKSERIKPGQEPCEKLYKNKKTHYCPFQQICSTHHDVKDLFTNSEGEKVNVWILNAYSLLSRRLPSSYDQKRRLYIDYVYDYTDLLIIDEADLIQLQLESMFAEGQSLEGKGKDKYTLDDMNIGLSTSVQRMISQNKRRTETKEQFELVKKNLEIQQHLVSFTHYIKSDDSSEENARAKFLRQILSNKIVNPLYLVFNLLSYYTDIDETLDIREIPSELYQYLRNIFTANISRNKKELEPVFLNPLIDPVEDTNEKFLSMFCDELVKYIDKLPVYENEEDLFERYRKHGKKNFITQLRMIVLLARLDYRLREISYTNNEIAKHYGLDFQHRFPLSRKIIPRLSHVVPYPTTDKTFGYQYTGKLYIRIYAGNARYLVHHLHDIFLQAEERYGPPVLLTSATSWIPQSEKFHISIKPKYVLKSFSETVKNLEQSEVYFAPVSYENEPTRYIKVSGNSRNYYALEQIIEKYCIGNEESYLQRILDDLPPLRNNLLIVVGSYDEVEIVKDKFDTFPYWSTKTVRLVGDYETSTDPSGTVSRSEVESMLYTGKRILIAPLLSIERGYNILNRESKSYFGGIMFLKRPIPIPYDYSIQISLMNATALQVYNRLTEYEKWHEFGDFAYKKTKAIEDWYFKNQTYFVKTDEKWKEYVIATMTVLIWQAIGRTIRGHQDTKIYFVDGSFVSQVKDNQLSVLDNENSFIVKMRDFLVSKQDGDILDKELFGAISIAFKNLKRYYID